MPFVWSIGTIVGPSIGGMFANPHDSWPEAFPAGGLFQRYPYLLPNLICSGLLLVSIVLGFLLLEETHPDMQNKYVPAIGCHPVEETPLTLPTNRNATEVHADAYGTIEIPSDISTQDWGTLCVEDEKETADIPTKTWNRQVVGFIVALSIFTYHSMTFDHLLPIFFEEKRADAVEMLQGASLFPFYSPGGLGLTLRDVGVVMAIDGGIALFIQVFIFPGLSRSLELTVYSSSLLSSTQSSTF
ncbi:hypothetical protein SNK04_009637 [Fusarium graminearum]